MNTKNAEAPDRKRGRGCAKKEPARQKKEAKSLSAVTNGVTPPKSFLLLVEGAMRPSLDDAQANLSTSSCRLFYQRPTTKRHQVMNSSKSQLRHHIRVLKTTTENTGVRHIS